MRAISRPCCSNLVALGVLLLSAEILQAQVLGFSAATIQPSPGVSIQESGTLRVPVTVRIRRGYHINSDQPQEDHLIPTRLMWNDMPFSVDSIEYPSAEEVQYPFSSKPMSVFSSLIEIMTTLQVQDLPDGPNELTGSFRFQACNDKACLPPRTIPVVVPLIQ